MPAGGELLQSTLGRSRPPTVCAPGSRQFDARSRQFDPRSRQFDARSRQFDPRSRQFDARSRQFDARSRQFDAQICRVKMGELGRFLPISPQTLKGQLDWKLQEIPPPSHLATKETRAWKIFPACVALASARRDARGRGPRRGVSSPSLGARARARRRPPCASPRRANAVETERGDAASGSDADARLADYLRSWCASTRGGVRADAADVAELRGVVRARRDASRGAPRPGRSRRARRDDPARHRDGAGHPPRPRVVARVALLLGREGGAERIAPARDARPEPLPAVQARREAQRRVGRPPDRRGLGSPPSAAAS